MTPAPLTHMPSSRHDGRPLTLPHRSQGNILELLCLSLKVSKITVNDTHDVFFGVFRKGAVSVQIYEENF